jgi:hypothetical protein
MSLPTVVTVALLRPISNGKANAPNDLHTDHDEFWSYFLTSVIFPPFKSNFFLPLILDVKSSTLYSLSLITNRQICCFLDLQSP